MKKNMKFGEHIRLFSAVVFTFLFCSSFVSDVENKYLEAYIKTLKDGIITDDERRLLLMLANSYQIEDERVEYIEKSYNFSIGEEE